MPPLPKITASPTPGPSGFNRGRDRVADSLYAWCRQNYDPGYVFSQEELLSAGIIPEQKIEILLSSTQHLVQRALFKIHDRSGGTIGWELVEEAQAANFANLGRDEQLVYSCIANAGNAGIWNKTVKMRIQAHAQVIERTFKTLSTKGLIKPMKSVKNPGRKMWILASLQPSEEATGGSWYTSGDLDTTLLTIIAGVIEFYVAQRSWQEQDTTEPSSNNKRKAPDTGFDENNDARSKAIRTEGLAHNKDKGKSSKSAPPQKSYRPFPPGYTAYPTLQEISSHVLKTKVTQTVLPENAIHQLLQVMVYDEKLFTMSRRPTPEEDFDGEGSVVMYRSFKTPGAVLEKHDLERRKESHEISQHTRLALKRQEELEDIGQGGANEVPCMSCPVFDICGDGGSINALTCEYFADWYTKIAEADIEAGNGIVPDKHPTKQRERDKGHSKAGAVVDIEMED
ncbi:hypothetical protein PV10_03511 [Exophiala mesophila]|uniref:DNA-directed RNA polymerase III subunit RPC6 n=1 Tax=Exophiala mesophila TaxID=212818 RepID=A0A0D1Y5E8_EXOME|nr:uncharacterized protein PV10_03511 [Exophiala mesophila]KIV95911.1 hypothetical protein PV10_03511 [Exophiala mesophila]